MIETVRDLMTASPLCIGMDEGVASAAMTMIERRIRHLPAISDEGIVGLVTDEVVFGYGGLTGDGEAFVYFVDDAPDTVAALVVPAEVIVRPTDPLWLVLYRWRHANQDAVVVVDDSGRVSGILTEHDLVALAADRLDDALTVEAAASHYPTTVEATDSIEKAVRLMANRGFRHLVVTRDRVPVAMCSLRDLVTTRTRLDSGEPVQRCMSADLVSVGPDTSLRDVAIAMSDRKIGAVPVVEGDQLRSIITRRDLLVVLAEVAERVARPDSARVPAAG